MIDDEIAAAMKWAREHVNMTPEEFAVELQRLLPNHPVGADDVTRWEAGEDFSPRYLVAAARIAEQPVSVILDELSLYQLNYPALDRRLTRLEEKLREHGIT